MVSLQKYPVLVLIFLTVIKYAIKHRFFDKRTLKIKDLNTKTRKTKTWKKTPEKEHLKTKIPLFSFIESDQMYPSCAPPSNELSVSKNHVIWNSLRKMLSPNLPKWMCFLHVELIAFKLQNLPHCRSLHLFSDSFLYFKIVRRAFLSFFS